MKKFFFALILCFTVSLAFGAAVIQNPYVTNTTAGADAHVLGIATNNEVALSLQTFNLADTNSIVVSGDIHAGNMYWQSSLPGYTNNFGNTVVPVGANWATAGTGTKYTNSTGLVVGHYGPGSGVTVSRYGNAAAGGSGNFNTNANNTIPAGTTNTDNGVFNFNGGLSGSNAVFYGATVVWALSDVLTSTYQMQATNDTVNISNCVVTAPTNGTPGQAFRVSVQWTNGTGTITNILGGNMDGRGGHKAIYLGALGSGSNSASFMLSNDGSNYLYP